MSILRSKVRSIVEDHKGYLSQLSKKSTKFCVVKEVPNNNEGKSFGDP